MPGTPGVLPPARDSDGARQPHPRAPIGPPRLPRQTAAAGRRPAARRRDGLRRPRAGAGGSPTGGPGGCGAGAAATRRRAESPGHRGSDRMQCCHRGPQARAGLSLGLPAQVPPRKARRSHRGLTGPAARLPGQGLPSEGCPGESPPLPRRRN